MNDIKNALTGHLIKIISETNGISLSDTLELACQYESLEENPNVKKSVHEFRRLLSGFQQDEMDINTLFAHPVAAALHNFFKLFPLKYREEHIHLTGSLSAEFVLPRIKKLLEGPHKKIYEKKIIAGYGSDALPIETIDDVEKLIRLRDDQAFDDYLKILLLPKLILTDKKVHKEAAYHMAQELYEKHNVGMIRLKFTFSRASSDESEKIPGREELTEEDVVLGLFDGFMKFKKEHPDFNFILSPCFRKEESFFDNENFKTKKDHFEFQVDQILDILKRNPQLQGYLTDVDTVGSEKNLFRKGHFQVMRRGFRKLHYKGFSIRSHHGETWYTLKKGVQAVDNSMNIWHIDTLEHGLSLGINPNFYFHSLFQRVVKHNKNSVPVLEGSNDYNEIQEMDWTYNPNVKEKLLKGEVLDKEETIQFVKAKFHTAREVEHYQHDVLNRMIHKKVSLIALPTSNQRLTGSFPDYKDHPFTWWEKKGVKLGIGTDNYITLSTNYIKELLILLFTDPVNLKITKLLMVATGEERRPYLSMLLWKMRDKIDLET